LAPQHQTSCDPETITKEDFDYLRKIYRSKQTRSLPSNSLRAKWSRKLNND